MANKLTVLASVVAASTAVMSSNAFAADSTLDKVTKQGYLTCGVSTGLPGFSNPNAKGEWEGIDVEYCQAIAAAVLGDKTKVKYVPLTAKSVLLHYSLARSMFSLATPLGHYIATRHWGLTLSV